jgi:hypothetical protein
MKALISSGSTADEFAQLLLAPAADFGSMLIRQQGAVLFAWNNRTIFEFNN